MLLYHSRRSVKVRIKEACLFFADHELAAGHTVSSSRKWGLPGSFLYYHFHGNDKLTYGRSAFSFEKDYVGDLGITREFHVMVVISTTFLPVISSEARNLGPARKISQLRGVSPSVQGSLLRNNEDLGSQGFPKAFEITYSHDDADFIPTAVSRTAGNSKK